MLKKLLIKLLNKFRYITKIVEIEDRLKVIKDSKFNNDV